MKELKSRTWREHAKSLMVNLRDLVERDGCGKDDCWVQCEDGNIPFPLLVLVSLSPVCRQAVIDLGPLDKQITFILPHIQLGEFLLFMKYLFSRDTLKLYNKEDIDILRKVGESLAIDFEFDNLKYQLNQASKFIGTIRTKNPMKLKAERRDGKENSGPKLQKMFLDSGPELQRRLPDSGPGPPKRTLDSGSESLKRILDTGLESFNRTSDSGPRTLKRTINSGPEPSKTILDPGSVPPTRIADAASVPVLPKRIWTSWPKILMRSTDPKVAEATKTLPNIDKGLSVLPPALSGIKEVQKSTPKQATTPKVPSSKLVIPNNPNVRHIRLIKSASGAYVPLIVAKPVSTTEKQTNKTNSGPTQPTVTPANQALEKIVLNSPQRHVVKSVNTTQQVKASLPQPIKGISAISMKSSPAAAKQDSSSTQIIYMKPGNSVASQLSSVLPVEDSSANLDDSDDDVDSTPSDSEIDFACPFCNKETDRVLIQKHMKTSHVDIEHACLECKDIFKSKAELENHIQEHPRSKWYHTCKMVECRFVGISLYQMKIHRRTHFKETSGYELRCKYCDKIFIKSKSLKKHEAQHEDGGVTKTLKCIQCPKTFTKASNLTRHIKSHFGIKSFSCDMCNSDFVDATRLKEHKWTHFEHTRFTCPLQDCGQQFRHRSNLKIHLSKDHEGSNLDGEKVQCSLCSRTFAFQYKLRNHMRWHKMEEEAKKRQETEETVTEFKDASVYVCASCKREFKTIDDLGTHCKEYHSIPDDPAVPPEKHAPPPAKRKRKAAEKPATIADTSDGVTPADVSFSLDFDPSASVQQQQQQQLMELPPVTSLPDSTVVNCTVTPMDSSFAGLAVSVPVSLPVIQHSAAPTDDVLQEFEHAVQLSSVAVQNQLPVTAVQNQLPVTDVQNQFQLPVGGSTVIGEHQQLSSLAVQDQLTNSPAVVDVQNRLRQTASLQDQLSNADLPDQLRNSVISEIHGTSDYEAGMSQLAEVAGHVTDRLNTPDGSMPCLYLDYKDSTGKVDSAATVSAGSNNMPSLYLDYKDSTGKSVQLDPETKQHLETLDNIRLENLTDKSNNRLEFINELITKEIAGDTELISESIRMTSTGEVIMDLTEDEFDDL